MKNLLLGDSSGLTLKYYQMKNGSDYNYLVPLENGKYLSNVSPSELDIYGEGLSTFADEDTFDRVVVGEVYPEVEGSHLWSLEHHPEVGGYFMDTDNEILYDMDGSYYGFYAFYVISRSVQTEDMLQDPLPGVLYDAENDKVVYNNSVVEIPVYGGSDYRTLVTKLKTVNGVFHMTTEEFDAFASEYDEYFDSSTKRIVFTENDIYDIETSGVSSTVRSGDRIIVPPTGVYAGYFTIIFKQEKLRDTTIRLFHLGIE